MNPYHRNITLGNLLIRLLILTYILLILSNYFYQIIIVLNSDHTYVYVIHARLELIVYILNNIVENFNLELKHSTIVSGLIRKDMRIFPLILLCSKPR